MMSLSDAADLSRPVTALNSSKNQKNSHMHDSSSKNDSEDYYVTHTECMLYNACHHNNFEFTFNFMTIGLMTCLSPSRNLRLIYACVKPIINPLLLQEQVGFRHRSTMGQVTLLT